MLSSVCAAQGYPDGTSRVVPSYGNSETYYGSRGEYLGRSVANPQGGRNYYNQNQLSTRSVRTYNGGQRFYNTTPRNKSSVYGGFNKPSGIRK